MAFAIAFGRSHKSLPAVAASGTAPPRLGSGACGYFPLPSPSLATLRATPSCFRLLAQTLRLAFSFAACNAGKSIAARIAMIAITTSSSIRVNARRIDDEEKARKRPQEVSFIIQYRTSIKIANASWDDAAGRAATDSGFETKIRRPRARVSRGRMRICANQGEK